MTKADSKIFLAGQKKRLDNKVRALAALTKPRLESLKRQLKIKP